jgi:hypothetical protein
MFRKMMSLLAISTLVCFAGLALSPVCYAAPPKESKKTEKVEKKKQTPQNEKVKSAPSVDKNKEPSESNRKVPDLKRDKAEESRKKAPAKKEVKSLSEEKAKTKEAYDYFRDKNGDGIDDRLKEKKTEKEEIPQKKDESRP